MFLSQLLEKPLRLNNTNRGVCNAVGISLKNGACKYLLCASEPQSRSDFALNFSALTEYNEYGLTLSSLRPVVVKAHARICLQLPVFSHNGKFLGNMTDAEIANGVLIRLYTDKNQTLPFTSIAAVADAIILQKNKPYPIGQRVPAPYIDDFTKKNEPLITRSVLQKAMQKQALIKLTLSLPPFSMRVD